MPCGDHLAFFFFAFLPLFCLVCSLRHSFPCIGSCSTSRPFRTRPLMFFHLPFQTIAISLCSSLRPDSRVQGLPGTHFRLLFLFGLIIRSLPSGWLLSLLVLAVPLSHLVNSLHFV
jgi:hypothetical protein